MIDVSVVIPAYNTERYLHQCISSVLSQEVDLEIILVDDGSTDGSRRICEYYSTEYPMVITLHQENEGQGVARNLGMSVASGRYFYFLDSDDFLMEGALRTLLNTSDKYDLDICAPASLSHYYDRPFEYISCLPTRMQFIRAQLVRDHSIHQPSTRSGQDGVFSHEVLCFARNMGVAQNARIHYRRSRPGSTFEFFRSRSDLVQGIVTSHYAHLEKRYSTEPDSFIEVNSQRLLSFVNDETLKNRIFPHLASLPDETVSPMLEAIQRVARPCLERLSRRQRAYLSPQVLAAVQRDPEDGCRALRRYARGEYLSPIAVSRNLFIDAEKVTLCTTSANSDGALKALGRNVSKTGEDRQSPQVNLVKAQYDLLMNTLNHTNLRLRAQELAAGGPTGATVDGAPIVSMTTIPSRLSTLHYSLSSILTQTIRPDRVIVWLDPQARSSIDSYPALRRLEDFGVEFVGIPDVGSHSKLYYSLKENFDRPVVTFDDDIIYPENSLETMYRLGKTFPSSIIANWAREIPPERDLLEKGIRTGRLLTPPRLEERIETKEEFEPTPLLAVLPYGTGGILYPAGCFDARVTDARLMQELCPTEDDVWFRCMAILAGTTVVPSNLGVDPIHLSVLGSQHTALRHTNHGGRAHGSQIANTFKYFDIFKILEGQHLAAGAA